jgi:hypothetical protein
VVGMVRHRRAMPPQRSTVPVVPPPTSTLLDPDPLIPWDVQPRHLCSHTMTHLCLESRRRAGQPLSPRAQRRLQEWLDALEEENVVVDYDPDRGFRYVERDPTRDHGPVRAPTPLR